MRVIYNSLPHLSYTCYKYVVSEKSEALTKCAQERAVHSNKKERIELFSFAHGSCDAKDSALL